MSKMSLVSCLNFGTGAFVCLDRTSYPKLALGSYWSGGGDLSYSVGAKKRSLAFVNSDFLLVKNVESFNLRPID